MSAASSSSCSSIVGSRDHASKSSLSSMPPSVVAVVIQLNQRCVALFRMSPPKQNSGNNFVLWKVRHARVPGCKKQKASI